MPEPHARCSKAAATGTVVPLLAHVVGDAASMTIPLSEYRGLS